jgi:CBS domain containing-hemolysin-like protein
MSQFNRSVKFSLGIAVITFVLAAIFTIISSILLQGVGWWAGMLIVLGIVLVGVIFDMFGIAAASADEIPFHAMASEKVNGSKQAIVIIRNADRFASFCNDVIGDISGIVSGTASASVVLQIALGLGFPEDSTDQITVSILFTSLVAAVTVGGKALGKHYAIHSSTNIILFAGKIIAFMEKYLHIKILPALKKNNKGRNS